MSYLPTEWIDHQPPGIDAAQLGRIEAGVSDAHKQFLPLRSGLYMFTSWGGVTTGVPPNNGLRAYPWAIPHSVNLVLIGCEVTSAGQGGSVVRLGVYNDAGGYPGALLVDAGTINGASATVQELTINLALEAGMYWVAAATQAASTTPPTMRILSSSSIPGLAFATIPTTVHGYEAAGQSGAFPAIFPAGDVPVSAIPRIFVKTA